MAVGEFGGGLPVRLATASTSPPASRIAVTIAAAMRPVLTMPQRVMDAAYGRRAGRRVVEDRRILEEP